ncbi:uncharacterized protein maca [Drosophila bipectinata]|uniref:uncharacterized protein maca n=1 Tax=Drosophila bipectinata TaxID=42026 RepID=UPI0038B28412
MKNSLDLDNKKEDQMVPGFPSYYIPPRTPISFPTYSSGSEDLQKNQGALLPYSAVAPPSGYETSDSSKPMEVASITKNFVEQSSLAVQPSNKTNLAKNLSMENLLDLDKKREDQKILGFPFYYIPPKTPIAFPTYSSGSGDLEKNQGALVPYSGVTPPSGYETSDSSKPMEVASMTKNFVEQSPLDVQNKKEDEKVPGFPSYYIPPKTPIAFPTYSSGSGDLEKNQGALVPYSGVTPPSGYETSDSSKPMEVASMTKNFVEQSSLVVQNKKEDQKVPGFPSYYIPPRTPISFPTYSSGSEDLQKNQGALLPYSAVAPPSGYQTSGSPKPMEVPSITKNVVEQSSLAVQRSNKTNLMVNYLPRDMAEYELADMFSTFGQLRRVKIVRDQSSGMSLGYGFIDFVNSCKANVAQIMLNGRKVRDKVLKVTYACPRGDDPRNNSLYVAQLPPGVNHFQIRELFETYGHVLDVNFLLNKATGEPRGVAFVRFNTRTSAEQAQMLLDGIVPKFSSQPIEVKFVRRKPPISNPDHADADQRYGPGGQVGQDGPGEQDGKPSILKWPFIKNYENKIQEGSPPQLSKRRTDEQKVEQQIEAKRPRGFVYDSD